MRSRITDVPNPGALGTANGGPPVSRHSSTSLPPELPFDCVRQRTVLGGVGGQLMQNDCHRLSGFCGKVDSRASNNRTLVLSAEGQLTANELTKVYTLPAATAQQGVRIRQRIDATAQHLKKFV